MTAALVWLDNEVHAQNIKDLCRLTVRLDPRVCPPDRLLTRHVISSARFFVRVPGRPASVFPFVRLPILKPSRLLVPLPAHMAVGTPRRLASPT